MMKIVQPCSRKPSTRTLENELRAKTTLMKSSTRSWVLAAGRQVESAKLDATFQRVRACPECGKLSVRFFMSGMFGSMLDNLRKHYDRIDITRAPYEKKYLSPYFLLAETANPNAKQAAATSVLAGALMRSILADAPYPEALYSNVLLRVRATQDDDDRRTRKVTRGRVAIIKAYLIKNLNKEAVTVSLDETKRDTPYMLDDCSPCWNACRKRPIRHKNYNQEPVLRFGERDAECGVPGHHEAWPEPSE